MSVVNLDDVAVQCHKCQKWFRNNASWSDHYLYYCFNHYSPVFRVKTLDNDLNLLSDYLNGKVNIYGRKL